MSSLRSNFFGCLVEPRMLVQVPRYALAYEEGCILVETIRAVDH